MAEQRRQHTRRRTLLYRTGAGEDVYTERHHLDVQTGLMHFVEVRVGLGVVHERDMTAGPWREVERTNCRCCSCPGGGGGDDLPIHKTDPACRMHGWWGRRPCEAHKTEGEVNPEGVVPEPIQEYRDRLAREAAAAATEQKGSKR